MKNKKIYLLRHGESSDRPDESGMYVQTPDSYLTKAGIIQAEKVALEFDKISFDKFYSSHYKRAMQTADEIKKTINLDYKILDYIYERIYPSKLVGAIKGTPEFDFAIDEFYSAFIRGEKYEDAESFAEIKQRALNLLKFLEKTDDRNILVVSHGMFLRVVAAAVVLGEDMSMENTLHFMRNMRAKNTGVSVIEIKDGKWLLNTWNDYTHLN